MKKVENIAYAGLTRFIENGEGEKELLLWVENDLSKTSFSYSYFETMSNRVAGILREIGVNTGYTVSLCIPRSPMLIRCFFDVLKNAAISSIILSTLGESALRDRLSNSNARVIITKKSLLRKIITIKHQLPTLERILVVDIDEDQNDYVLSLKRLLSRSSSNFDYPHYLDAEAPAFLQYTSGSTGKPKGALHVHGAIADIEKSFKEIMQLQADDLYWCTADPAWITGLVYGIIAPFITATRQLQYNGTYNADNLLRLLVKEKVTVWSTAPTALCVLLQQAES